MRRNVEVKAGRQLQSASRFGCLGLPCAFSHLISVPSLVTYVAVHKRQSRFQNIIDVSESRDIGFVSNFASHCFYIDHAVYYLKANRLELA